MPNAARDAGIRAERGFAKALQRAAGRVEDPVLRNVVTSTGRVGELTSLGFDLLIGNPETGTALVGESKRRKTTLGAEALKALLQLVRISHEWKRAPAFCFALADNAPEWVPTRDGKRRVPRSWVAFPLEYVCSLLEAKRENVRLRAYLLERHPDVLMDFVDTERKTVEEEEDDEC
jgi:hypothetical protein